MKRIESLEKIRVRFLFDNPFLSVLALSIDIVENSEQNSIFATDGRKIYLNPQKLQNYSFEELRYLYAHQLLHIILKHAFRCGKREKKLWNHASDFVINALMEKMKNVGIRPPSEPFSEKYYDMVAEEVYAILEKSNYGEGERSDEDCTDLLSLDTIDGDEIEEESEIDKIIIQALTLARSQSHLPSSFFAEIEEVERSDIGIGEILQEYLNTSLFEKEISYNRPNRRYIWKNIYLPGSSKPKEQLVALIAFDSSASVSFEEYRFFLSSIMEICESFYDFSLLLIPFCEDVYESCVCKVDSYNFKSAFLKIPKRDGGTNFDAVIDFIDKNYSGEAQRRVLLVLSDGFFEVHKNIPIETIFAITKKRNIERFERYGRTFWLKI